MLVQILIELPLEEVLEKERISRKMSQLEFSNLLGISDSTYSNLIRGLRPISEEKLISALKRIDLQVPDYVTDDLKFVKSLK